MAMRIFIFTEKGGERKAYNEPEMIVLGDATELIQGSKGGGLECIHVHRLDFAEEAED